MKIPTRSLLLALLMTVIPARADTSKLGVIGDSLSTAMSADDRCQSIDACLLQIRPAGGFSFAAGVQPWSLRRRLAPFGVDAVIDRSRNGARWDDAPVQARTIVADPEVRYVSIELGGNDVCRDAGEALPPLGEIGGHVEQTLSLLSERLAPGSAVLLAEVPDVGQLYELVRARPHFLFRDCQALWDLDASRLSDEAVLALCDRVLSEASCASPLALTLARPLVGALFEETFRRNFGASFPCGKVLSSDSDDADRAAARNFNLELNALLADKARSFDGRNGVAVRFAAGVYQQRFAADDVSRLDCFHPSIAGQQTLADAIWQGLKLDTGGDRPLFEDGFETP